MSTLLEQISDLDAWCLEAEKTDIGYSWAEYGRESGLSTPEDKENITRFSKQQEQLSRLLLFLMQNSIIPRDKVPDVLYFETIARTQKSKTAEAQDKIRDARKKEIEIEGHRVSIDNWRKFNQVHLKNPGLRRKVFDAIIKEAEVKVAPLVQQYFDSIRESYASQGLSVLDVYCKLAGITVERLKEVVDKSGMLARKPFLEMAEIIWPKVLGYGVNNIDDYYVWRPIVFQDFGSVFEKADPVKLFSDIMEKLEMQNFFRYVSIDDKPRPGKHPSPVCFTIDVPRIVKILFQRSKPFEDCTSMFHEGGHGVHYSCIDPNAPYWDKYLVHTTIAEIPSTTFESVFTETTFLKNRLGIEPSVIERMHEREKFFEYFYLTFYAANSIMKIDFWEKGLNVEKATERYNELTKRYGIELPGGYWLTHHVMPMNDLYSPSYLLSKIRTACLLRKLKDEHGEMWYDEPKSGEYLREVVFKPGAAVKLETFSRLDSNDYFKDFGLI